MAAGRMSSISVLSIQLLVFCAWLSDVMPSADSAPIKITTFEGCVPAFSNNQTHYCCPPLNKGEIVDFYPKRDRSKPLRVRKALQCLSGKELKVYTEKLDKAYGILRNLPEDDPRSLVQQVKLHCAYGAGAFIQEGTGNITIDIHFSWFLYPWHRYFIYFHERILQHVLGDPDFSLHFWNWDNGVSIPTPRGGLGGCYKAGHYLPEMYNVSSTAQNHNRSVRTTISGLPVDLGILPEDRFNPPTRPAEVVEPINVASMYEAAVVLGNNTRGFMGREYRIGDYQVAPLVGGGALEVMGHASVHWWVGNDLAVPETAAADPLFYAHHSNIDRLWQLWHSLPGGHRVDYSEPDFLEGEFLFYDETATLRRVKVKDSLVMEEFGYTYQKANDAVWTNYKPATNSTNSTTTGQSFRPVDVHFPTRWNKDD